MKTGPTDLPPPHAAPQAHEHGKGHGQGGHGGHPGAAGGLFQLPELKLRRYAKGEYITYPGSGDDAVFQLQSGRLRVFLSGDDKELTLAFLEPGEVFSSHTRAWVEAVSDCSLLIADTKRFQAQLLSDPKLTPAIIRVFARLLSNSINIIENLAFRDVSARLANFVLGLARAADADLPMGLRVPLQLRTEDIARLLGTSRQTVSSLISQLVRDGVLAREGRRALLLLDPAELARRAKGSELSSG
ncbi:helix-turn-helix domain-containing protein [Azoarcus indigens]|uniref:CRP-like cAMP-binding protein n=1 Tax=Azoarcus indigens TaxID=29545 RepID=A0A4V3BL62_9RHOO|nr:Crp/Fnr family transcriptional regulator [Azoarcus indigens]NMG67689.1 helix-turn-helix domain-containing protein [Azoarcus indigens]TDN45502.1 CRP-like cAMP-binding protein [Azoarcus indigens]